MNPSSNEASGIQLPAPIESASGVGGERSAVPEQAVQPAQTAPTASAAPPLVAAPLPMAPPTPPAPSPTSGAPTASLIASDDTDLIEKEWVDKAKAIVERTRDDPYKQSEELTMVKADYMKKRYNKTIKLST